MYQCQDCTHKAKVFPDGICTGCGSRNVRRIQHDAPNKTQARKGFRLSLGWILWLYLAFGIYRRYFMG